MFDSTARAERIDLPVPESAFYAWEPAQKPVAARLPFSLIDRLETEAVETFRSLSSRGSEIGGLLLGSVAPGNPAIVTVADYELIACDYSRGPLYRLSDIDQGRFEQAIERHSSGAGLRVVGYFRSHTRKGLSLDAEDVAFFEPRFLEPQHIVLLVRPFATKASTAGIFIRENGRIGETSHLEFPFRTSELGAAHSAEMSEPASSTAPASTMTPSVPKSPSRAQIVPIASRREMPLPEPAATPTPAAPVAAAPIIAEPVETPAPAPVKTPVVAPALGLDKAEKIVAPPAPAPVPEVKPAPAAPVPEFLSAPVAKSNKKLRLIVAAALCMLVLVGGSLVVYPALRGKSNLRSTAAQQDASALSLRVERTAGGMLLSWNRDLPAIQHATKVVLSITDGDRHEDVALDPEQVRTGNIQYQPSTGDVSFQMQVTNANQAKTTSESLRVLDPRPSPLAAPSDVHGSPQTAATKPAAPTVTATDAAVGETKPQEESTPSHPAPPLKAFNTESLAQRLRPVAPTDLPEAPAITRSNTQASAALPGIVTSQPLAPPPPKAPASATPTTTTPAANSAGGQIKPAVIVSRVDPEYPRIARQAGAGGTVELEATIGEDGKVKNAHVVRGSAMLQKAAIDAVMQWRYKPAMLNGKPVESPINIRLNFVAH